MISIISFIVVIFGSINWLAIGFFQYDLVAGLFGYQGSIFSRIVYIVIGICAIYLVYSVIKNKGRISVKKLVKKEKLPFKNDDKDDNESQDKEDDVDKDNEKDDKNDNSKNEKSNKKSKKVDD